MAAHRPDESDDRIARLVRIARRHKRERDDARRVVADLKVQLETLEVWLTAAIAVASERRPSESH